MTEDERKFIDEARRLNDLVDAGELTETAARNQLRGSEMNEKFREGIVWHFGFEEKPEDYVGVNRKRRR